MVRKLTALELVAEGEKQPGIHWKNVIYPVILLAAISGAAYSGYQLVVESKYQSGKAAVASAAENLGRESRQVLEEYGKRVASLSADSEVLAALSSGSDNDLVACEASLSRRLPDSLRIRMLDPLVENLTRQPFPGLGFAELALLLQAKNSSQLQGPGIGLPHTQNANLSWAVPVADQTGLKGFVLVSYPVGIVGGLIDEVEIGKAYVDFRKVSTGNTLLIAFSRGSLQSGSVDDVETTSVEGTLFHIGYFSPLPFLHADLSRRTEILTVVLSMLLIVLTSIWRFKPELITNLGSDRGGKPGDSTVLLDPDEDDDDLEEAMSFAQELQSGPGPASTPSAVAPQSIFRAYDIRGVVGKTLTIDIARDIGMAIGSEGRDRGVKQLVVARDGRLSGAEMSTALTEGLCAVGIDVIDVGAVPTGVLYFATHHLDTGSGVMVTGSHNPAEYNGFKIVLGGETLAGEAIQELYQRLLERRFAEGSGGVQEMDILEEYVERIASDVQVEEPLKVVIDCGNGIGGMIAPRVLEEIGCEVVPLYCEVDGNFPNHHPDPSVAENLRDLIVTVERVGADLGIALDGDGDRIGMVTKDGENIFPDRLLMLFAKDVLTRNPGAAIIYDVKCTGHLAKVILNHGGSPIMWKTGHSFIKAKMQETDAALAGEMSGHFFFGERWYGFDDGIYAAARLLEILAAEPGLITEILMDLPDSVSTPEIKIEMEEGDNYAFMESFKGRAQFEGARITNIDGIRADYEDGWGLVRCSNTTPSLVLRFDANSEEGLQRIKEVFTKELLAVRPDLNLPF